MNHTITLVHNLVVTTPNLLDYFIVFYFIDADHRHQSTINTIQDLTDQHNNYVHNNYYADKI